MKRSIALMFAVLMSTGYAAAADHPDSVNQPPRDGCNRSDLVYLGEAAVALEHEGGPNAAPEWVYVNDPGKPGEIRTIRTVEGSVVAIHTAGQDLFGNHRTYDLNIDLVELDPKHPDPAFERLVSSRNARETPPQIHTEWESGLVPLWVLPSPRDRVRETGSWIWDCGHWQEGSRSIPNSDLLPGDPLGTAGVEHIGGEEAEIHPISELATWRSPRAFVPSGRRRAVPVSQLDVYISNQGGGAKSVIECAIAPAAPANAAERAATETGCTQLQDVTGKDYVYDVVAPPRPSRGAKLLWRQVSHGSHHAPAAEVKVLRDRIRVTVPFKSSHAAAATALQDFGASYYVWWEGDHSPTYRFRVSLVQLTIFNNLDGDAGQSRSNPTITPNGEWNPYLDITGKWRALHQEMKAAGRATWTTFRPRTCVIPTTFRVSPRVRSISPTAARSGCSPTPAIATFRSSPIVRPAMSSTSPSIRAERSSWCRWASSSGRRRGSASTRFRAGRRATRTTATPPAIRRGAMR